MESEIATKKNWFYFINMVVVVSKQLGSNGSINCFVGFAYLISSVSLKKYKVSHRSMTHVVQII